MPRTIGRIDHETVTAPAKLDMKDKRILTLLAKDARAPLTAIAKKVGLSRDAVDYRIKRMQQDGIIMRCFANLDYEKLGHYAFHVFFLLDEMEREQQAKLFEYLRKHPNVRSMIEYSDRWDIEISILARDLLEFDSVILEICGKFPDAIVEKDKVEIIRKYNTTFMPPLVSEKGYGREIPRTERVPEADVDETDLKILRLLCDDCRQSTYDIGAKVGLSADAVNYRIKSLVEEGVIRNFTILANLSLLGYYWYTYTVEMKMFDHEHETMFQSFLEEHPNILRSAKTLGGWDLLLYIVAHDPREFHATVKALKNQFANIIRNYQTWIAYKEHYYDPMTECLLRPSSGKRR